MKTSETKIEFCDEQVTINIPNDFKAVRYNHVETAWENEVLSIIKGKFPKIDLSFLLSVQPETKTKSILYPKFSVHKFVKCMFDTCEATIRMNEGYLKDYYHIRYWSIDNRSMLWEGGVKNKKDFRSPNGFEIPEFDRPALSFMCSFHGIIPEKTKSIIRQYENIFDTILLIKETKNWKPAPEPTGDPLVIGVFNNCEDRFLIDKFDCSSLEEYLSREFTY